MKPQFAKSSLVLTLTLAVCTTAACLLHVPVAYAQAGNSVLTLNGSTTFATVPTASDLQNPTQMTLEAWILPTVTPGAEYSLLLNKSDGLNALSDRTFELRWYSNGNCAVWFFLNHVDGASDAANIGAPVPANVWTHVAATYNSAEGIVRFYTNGVFAAQNATGNGLPFAGRAIRQSSQPVLFGWGPPNSTTHASGAVDEVRIWTKARVESEIAETMHCRLSGAEPNLAGYWNFDNGAATDISGQGHDAALSIPGMVQQQAGIDTIHAGCASCIPHRATATLSVVNGFVVGATVLDGGCGYTNAPTVLISGAGSGATATATVTDGVVSAINIISAGSGYTGTATVKIASPPFLPWLETAVTRVKITLHVLLGRHYILLASTDLESWTQLGDKFTAVDEVLTQEIDVDTSGRFLKVQEVP